MEILTLILILLIFGVVATGIYGVVQADFEDRRKKPLWIMVIILAPVLGSMLWTLLRHRFLSKKRIQFRA